MILLSVERVASYYEIYALNTGVYIKEDSTDIDFENFDPEEQAKEHEIDYKIYFIQLFMWGAIVIVAKTILYLFQMLFASVLAQVTIILLGWLNIYPNVKLLLIMVVIPFFFNAIQFWIQDNILKADKKKNIEFLSNARIARSLTMKPRRYPKLTSFRETKRSETLTSANAAALGL